MITVYVASKSRHWPWWAALRAAGIPIAASWIDAEFNRTGAEPPDWALHWMKCIDEAAAADVTLMFADNAERQMGALVEVGAALRPASESFLCRRMSGAGRTTTGSGGSTRWRPRSRRSPAWPTSSARRRLRPAISSIRAQRSGANEESNKMTKLQRMDAEILFLDPNDVSSGSAALIEHGFDVEVLDDRIDDYGPAMWIQARITTDVAEDDFFDWVESVVNPLRGDVLEAGLSDQPPAGRLPGVATH
jgi:hypothetical protein